MIKYATVLQVNPDSLFVVDSTGQEILVYTQNAQQFIRGIMCASSTTAP